MERVYKLILISAIFTPQICYGLKTKIQIGEPNLCEVAVRELNSICGTKFIEVISDESMKAAMMASCQSEVCLQAVAGAFSVCSNESLLSLENQQTTSEVMLLRFFCKTHPNGEKCGNLVLNTDIVNDHADTCSFLMPLRVPDVCSPECAQVVRRISREYGCCWTEFVQFSYNLINFGLAFGEFSVNATDFWDNCDAPNPGFCRTTGDLDLSTGVDSGEIASVPIQKPVVIGITLIASLAILLLFQ